MLVMAPDGVAESIGSRRTNDRALTTCRQPPNRARTRDHKRTTLPPGSDVDPH
jgi:hypothetical protein